MGWNPDPVLSKQIDRLYFVFHPSQKKVKLPKNLDFFFHIHVLEAYTE